MTNEDLFCSLCSYDPRNPICADLAACRDDDDPVPVPGAKGCGCENCFYGRHKMADEILRIRGVASQFCDHVRGFLLPDQFTKVARAFTALINPPKEST